MREHMVRARAAHIPVARVLACNIELVGDVQHQVRLLWWRLVGQFWRWSDPYLCRLMHFNGKMQTLITAKPYLVQCKPPRHRIDQGPRIPCNNKLAAKVACSGKGGWVRNVCALRIYPAGGCACFGFHLGFNLVLGLI